jgi:hypothetical protein
MKIATVIKNMINDRLKHVFISYTSNKKLEIQIENGCLFIHVNSV